MFIFSSTARDQVDAQGAALGQRLDESGMYLQERGEFAAARAAFPIAAERLGLVEDLERSLTTEESRNLVRLVRLANGELAVLKVIGSTLEPGEGQVLQEFKRLGLPTLEPLAYFEQQVEVQRGLFEDGRPRPGTEMRTALVLLTPYVNAKTLLAAPSSTLQEKRQLLVRIVSGLPQFHLSGAQIPETRSWLDREQPHLRWTLPALLRNGLELPDSFERVARRSSKGLWSAVGNVLLLGDAYPGNILGTEEDWTAKVEAEGDIYFDPPGGIWGPPEADVAQVIAQVGNLAYAEELVVPAIEAYREASKKFVENGTGIVLNETLLRAHVGVIFGTWAGYAVAGHNNPDANVITGQDRGNAEAAKRDAQRFLDACDAFIGPMRRTPPRAVTQAYFGPFIPAERTPVETAARATGAAGSPVATGVVRGAVSSDAQVRRTAPPS